MHDIYDRRPTCDNKSTKGESKAIVSNQIFDTLFCNYLELTRARHNSQMGNANVVRTMDDDMAEDTEEALYGYKVDKCTRREPKLSLPIRLEDQCLKFLMEQYKRASAQIGRNCKAMKEFRAYVKANVAQNLLQDLVERAVPVYSAEEILNFLELFHPERLIRENVNLVAANSQYFVIENRENAIFGNLGLFQYFGIHKRNLLSVCQLNKLHNIFLWSSPSQLKQLSVAVAKNAFIGQSNLPHTLARAHSLTKLTILCGADNHTLRIVGLNCPSLRFLNVSMSRGVSDQGFQGLLLRWPSRRTPKPALTFVRLGTVITTMYTESNLRDPIHLNQLIESERNPCADTLDTIVATQTGVSLQGLKFVCEVMKQGYCLDLFKKSFKIFRVKNFVEVEEDTEISSVIRELITFCMRNMRFTHTVLGRRVQEIFKGKNDAHVVLCHFGVQNVYFIGKIESNQITVLVQTEASINVLNLGRLFPNLKYYFGTLHLGNNGERLRLNNNNEYLMPHLEAVNSSECDDSSIVLFLLRFAPSLKSLRVFFYHEYSGAEETLQLTDHSLECCLRDRKEQVMNLEDIVIVGSRFLTIKALTSLIEHCPNLERIGDLHSWQRILDEDVTNFNLYLDKINSKCVLSAIGYPISKREQGFFNSFMTFAI